MRTYLRRFLLLSLFGITSVSYADPTAFTNSGIFAITSQANGTGLGSYAELPPTFFSGDANSPMPGWDANVVWDWSFQITDAFVPVGEDPLVIAAPYASQSTVSAFNDAGELLGVLGLAGDGVLDTDLNFAASIVDETWSSQIYTPYRLVETYEITEQTGIYEDIIKVGEWSTLVQGRSARGLFAGGEVEASTTNPVISSTSTFVISGEYDFASESSVNIQTAVSPGEFADVEAPNVANLDGFPSYRLQQTYGAEDFAHLGDGPYTITRFDWRAGAEMVETIDYPTDNFLVKFSASDFEPIGEDGSVRDLDPVFASNIGVNEQIVYDGPLTLTTTNEGPAEGPKNFDYGLELQTPYVYDPADGALLMDLTVTNGQSPLLLDFVFEPTQTTRFQWTGSLGADSDVAAAGQSGGNIVQFQVEFPASPVGVDFDCNLDGIVDVNDLNCTTTDGLQGALDAAGLPQGDIDGDGTVGFEDFLILSNNFSQSGDYSDGDLNLDGVVQFTDFLILSQNFADDGEGVSSVPEPATGPALLSLFGLTGLAIRRKKSNK